MIFSNRSIYLSQNTSKKSILVLTDQIPTLTFKEEPSVDVDYIIVDDTQPLEDDVDSVSTYLQESHFIELLNIHIEIIQGKKVFQQLNFQNAKLDNLNLEGLRFEKANFKGSSFIGANLRGIYFAGANLSNCRFTKACLKDANLEHAHLNNVDFTETNLIGANLIKASLNQVTYNRTLTSPKTTWNKDYVAENCISISSGVDFANLDLSNCDISGCDLSDCNLTNTNLDKANLRTCQYSQDTKWPKDFPYTTLGAFGPKTILKGNDLSKKDLSNIDFSHADLSETDLRQAKLSNVNFMHANLTGANLSSAICSRTNFQSSTLIKSNFSFAKIVHCDFLHANLSDTEFTWSKISYSTWPEDFDLTKKMSLSPKSDLSNQDLSGKDLSNLDLSGVNFQGSNLKDVNLSFTSLQRANFMDANCENAKFQKARLADANFKNANLCGAQFEGYIPDIGDAIFRGAKTDFKTQWPNEFAFYRAIDPNPSPKEELKSLLDSKLQGLSFWNQAELMQCIYKYALNIEAKTMSDDLQIVRYIDPSIRGATIIMDFSFNDEGGYEPYFNSIVMDNYEKTPFPSKLALFMRAWGQSSESYYKSIHSATTVQDLGQNAIKTFDIRISPDKDFIHPMQRLFLEYQDESEQWKKMWTLITDLDSTIRNQGLSLLEAFVHGSQVLQQHCVQLTKPNLQDSYQRRLLENNRNLWFLLYIDEDECEPTYGNKVTEVLEEEFFEFFCDFYNLQRYYPDVELLIQKSVHKMFLPILYQALVAQNMDTSQFLIEAEQLIGEPLAI